jgi:hypothetical protein
MRRVLPAFAATGDGGTCYGDSGGPNFLCTGPTETEIIAGITITGGSLCKSTNVRYSNTRQLSGAPHLRPATLGGGVMSLTSPTIFSNPPKA